MIKFLIGMLLLIGIHFTSEKPQELQHDSIEKSVIDKLGPELNLEPYVIKFDMKPLQTGVYDLVIDMQLHNDAYFVSPNAKRDFSGKFTVHINDAVQLKILSGLIETPRSVEEYDEHPFVNGFVNWVRVDTKYNQQIQRTTDDDFQVMGYVQFTIEPRCSLEKIPFIIKYKEGKMVAELFQC